MSEGSPYRTGRASAPAAQPHEDGLVDELIRQFADPLAFYRELVQNSIDAGASRIVVALGWEPDEGAPPAPDAAGTLSVSVRDDGCGMGREVLENQLTVLFRSGKEGQEGKIGKFGVGFVSVLAVQPTLVEVRSSEGKGEQWTLQLAFDQTFELFHSVAGGESGTTVTLHVPVVRSEVERFVDGSERALRKWCRHAEIPIQLVASFHGASEPVREARIDRPLGLDGLVSVRVVEGGTTVVAALPSAPGSYLGFFNRGLLLHETREDVLGAVEVLIQDARLEHTLSRDNVRRDAHHERAMRLARRAIDRDLTREARRRLLAVADGAEPEPRLDVLLEAALRAGLAIEHGTLRFPLLCPIDGRRAITGEELRRRPTFVASARDALVEGAARAGHPVLDPGVAASPARYVELLATCYLGASSGDGQSALPDVSSALTLVTPVPPSPSDLRLLELLSELCDGLVRRPERPTFALLSGAAEERAFLAGKGAMREPFVLTTSEASVDPFRLLGRPPLILNAARPIVAMARSRASSDPGLAAALLTRALLLDRGKLDDDLDEEWLRRAARVVEEVGS